MPQSEPEISDEELEALLDNGLEPERRREIIDLIRNDPALLKRLAEYAALNEGVKKLYDFVLKEPIPQRLLDIIEGSLPDEKS